MMKQTHIAVLGAKYPSSVLANPISRYAPVVLLTSIALILSGCASPSAQLQAAVTAPKNNVPDKRQNAPTDISPVDETGDSLAVANKSNIGHYDVLSSVDSKPFAISKPDVDHFVRADDGSFLLFSAANHLSLWDDKLSKERWQLAYQRGTVKNLALSHNKHYGAVLSTQVGAYEQVAIGKFNALTDAIDIIDLQTGKIAKSLPNMKEQVVYMHFKDDDTLQIGLAMGKLFDWTIATGDKKEVANFAETIVKLDVDKTSYAYVTKDNSVRVSDGHDHIRLSLKNDQDPFKYAQLLDNSKKLLTVLASGDLALWDIGSGKKLLRLFSTKQGWTVMDAAGRFDGSEAALENFSWLANEDDIPLNNFSENYYEPNLLSNVLQNQDYINSAPDAVTEGINLPPKVNLQLADRQNKGEQVAVQLDVYSRGGGINKVQIFHNGKSINNDGEMVKEKGQDGKGEHLSSLLNITPAAGKNTLKVIASNDMGIENSSAEISFDGKTKAYTASVRLLTVGINKYNDSRINLLYSVADASAIQDALQKQTAIVANENLTDDQATKANILNKLRKLSHGEQEDVLVIYFAGHGMALDKEWYFLPYETKIQPAPEKIVAAGISASELSEIFKNSKIQHLMLIVDSCYSGTGIDAFKFQQLQNSQRYFARKMSRNLGMTIVVATAKDQKASELNSLGHGIFTYTMLKELQNKNATAHDIANNITKTLPAFSKQKLGFTQDPAVYIKGNDFMLTDERSNSKK